MKGAPHDQLQALVDVALALIDEIPAAGRPGSPRDTEVQVQRTLGSEGLARIALLDELNVDAQFAAANLAIILQGIADCLEAAASRDNQVNIPVLSIIVRSALEIAGQVAWLLDDTIDGAERGRRFLTWRFAELRTQRLLLGDFRPSNQEASNAGGRVGRYRTRAARCRGLRGVDSEADPQAEGTRSRSASR